MSTTQAQGAPMRRPVARGTIGGNRSGKAAPVTIQPQAGAQTMPRRPQPAPPAYPVYNEKQRSSGGKKALVFFVILAVLLLVGFFGYQILESEMAKTLDVNTIYNGVHFENQNFGGKSKEDLAAFAADMEKEKEDEVLFNIVLQDRDPLPVKLGEFKPEFDTETVVDEAYAVGREGNKISRYIKVRGLASDPQKFTVRYTIKESAIDKIVKKAAKEFDRKMTNASVEFKPTEETMFVAKGGKSGTKIDQDKLKADLTAAIDQGKTGDIQVTADVVQPKVTEEEAMANTQLMAQFSTTTTGAYNRDTNIQLASEAFNGVIVEPGEVFSINECTGQRTAAKGYKSAGAIKNGKMIQDLGGGVCQVSSTLYGAVIRADLEIVARQPHRWRSTYVPIGQDAAIDWPHADFKFKNNTDAPVYLRSTKVGTKLTVYIYGKPLEWEKIEVISWSTGELYPAATKTITDKSLAAGKKVTDTQSRVGETAVAYRVYYKDGKEHHRSKLPDTRHEPVQGIVRVGAAAPKKDPAPPKQETPAPKPEE